MGLLLVVNSLLLLALSPLEPVEGSHRDEQNEVEGNPLVVQLFLALIHREHHVTSQISNSLDAPNPLVSIVENPPYNNVFAHNVDVLLPLQVLPNNVIFRRLRLLLRLLVSSDSKKAVVFIDFSLESHLFTNDLLTVLAALLYKRVQQIDA